MSEQPAPQTTLLQQELAASRMAILRAADIAAELAVLNGSPSLRTESVRFLHQAARMKHILETGTAPVFQMPPEACSEIAP